MKKESENEELEKQIDEKEEASIAGISIINAIVSKAETVADPSTILSAIKQVVFFYQLIPEKWKTKAFFIFNKLWLKKKVVISTDPEKPERLYEISFEDIRLKDLYDLLPQVDQAIMLQGKSMLELINKSLHSDSDETKKNVEDKYGQRGLNIVNMITTRDVSYLLEELKNPPEQKDSLKKFNDWADNYDSISALISPVELFTPEKIIEKIIRLSKKNIKKFITINLSGTMEECTKLINLVDNLKKEEKLRYISYKPDIYDSGFKKSLRVRINFE